MRISPYLPGQSRLADPSLPIQEYEATFATNRAINSLLEKAEFLSSIDELNLPCGQLRSWNYNARLMRSL
jgi:hypothetical protein